jgi:TPR repeat protein
MPIKKQILNKIKSINDPEILRELDEWINNREKGVGKAGTVNESGEPYQALAVQKKIRIKNDPKSAINWLEKIAEKGGVQGIENPVDWQKKERRDRTLITS